MATTPQAHNHILGKAMILHFELIREPLVMDARRIDGLLNGEIKINQVYNDLKHSIDDGWTTRATNDKK